MYIFVYKKIPQFSTQHSTTYAYNVFNAPKGRPNFCSFSDVTALTAFVTYNARDSSGPYASRTFLGCTSYRLQWTQDSLFDSPRPVP